MAGLSLSSPSPRCQGPSKPASFAAAEPCIRAPSAPSGRFFPPLSPGVPVRARGPGRAAFRAMQSSRPYPEASQMTGPDRFAGAPLPRPHRTTRGQTAARTLHRSSVLQIGAGPAPLFCPAVPERPVRSPHPHWSIPCGPVPRAAPVAGMDRFPLPPARLLRPVLLKVETETREFGGEEERALPARRCSFLHKDINSWQKTPSVGNGVTLSDWAFLRRSPEPPL